MFIVKRCFFIIMLCFFITLLFFHHSGAEENMASSNKKMKGGESPAQNQPQITIDLSQVDLGEVEEGNPIGHTFIIKNTGTAQLNIDKVSAG